MGSNTIKTRIQAPICLSCKRPKFSATEYGDKNPIFPASQYGNSIILDDVCECAESFIDRDSFGWLTILTRI